MPVKLGCKRCNGSVYKNFAFVSTISSLFFMISTETSVQLLVYWLYFQIGFNKARGKSLIISIRRISRSVFGKLAALHCGRAIPDGAGRGRGRDVSSIDRRWRHAAIAGRSRLCPGRGLDALNQCVHLFNAAVWILCLSLSTKKKNVSLWSVCGIEFLKVAMELVS